VPRRAEPDAGGYLYDTRSETTHRQGARQSDPAYPECWRTPTQDVPLDGGGWRGARSRCRSGANGPGPLTRFRRSRWFWPVVGGAAGVVVLSVVIGVASASADADSRARFVVLNVLSKSF
jgi:hypothetical protein